MNESNSTDRWKEERTTFERVYDTVVGVRSFQTAEELANQARCSTTAARKVVEQLAEMGIAERRDGRPTTYRRNDAYFEWKRIESLATEHGTERLKERIEKLIAEDRACQDEYGVPEPNAVSMEDIAIDNHEALHDRWEKLNEWRSIRRDIRILRRAIERSERVVDDEAIA